MAKHLHTAIDELGPADSGPEFRKKLQDILHQMTYYLEMSDVDILEREEEWHAKFTDRMWDAAGQARKAAKTAAKAPKGTDGEKKKKLPPKVPTLPPKSSVPPSLQRLMNMPDEEISQEELWAAGHGMHVPPRPEPE